jgi:membrane protease YdiL (CAAX protease family)
MSVAPWQRRLLGRLRAHPAIRLLIILWVTVCLVAVTNIAGLVLWMALAAPVEIEAGVGFHAGQEAAREAFLARIAQPDWRARAGVREATWRETEHAERCGALGLQLTLHGEGQFVPMRVVRALSAAGEGLGAWPCGYRYRLGTPARLPDMLLFGALPVALVLGIALVFAARSPRGRALLLGWQARVHAPAAVALGLMAGLVSIAGVAAIGYGLMALGFTFRESPFDLRAEASLAIVGLALAVPLIEEYAFRAFALERSAAILGPGGALLLTSLLFAVLHFPDGLVMSLMYLLVGLWLGLLWLRFRSLLLNVIAHATHNAAALLLALVASGTAG